MYRLLSKCEVKMAGYWPSSFFCVFMDRDEVKVKKLTKLFPIYDQNAQPRTQECKMVISAKRALISCLFLYRERLAFHGLML